jgi:hypothetical protein
MIGQLETEDLRLQIAFPSRWSSGVLPRQSDWNGHFLLSVKIPSDLESKFSVPSVKIGEQMVYSWQMVGQRLTDLAAVWYGKQFNYQGIVALGDPAELPDFRPVSHSVITELDAYNAIPRPDLGIDLHLGQLRQVIELLYRREPEEKINAFWNAARFYASALRSYEVDAEIAYFHFVIALEIIASQIDVPPDDLYDEQTRRDLNDIRQQVSPEVESRIKKRLFQVRRRITYTVKHLLNSNFYSGSRATGIFQLTAERMESRIKSVYDLRSKYAHGGTSFATWFARSIGGATVEVSIGRPHLSKGEHDLEKILENIPTFTGLERTVRFVILSFAHNYILPIHERLQRSDD